MSAEVLKLLQGHSVKWVPFPKSTFQDFFTVCQTDNVFKCY